MKTNISSALLLAMSIIVLSSGQAFAIIVSPTDNGGNNYTNGSTDPADTSTTGTGSTTKCKPNDVFCADPPCTTTGSGTTATSSCSDPAASSTCQNDSSHTKCDIVSDYINPVINLLSGLVGLVAVISIIYSGIQYSMAGGDAQKVQKAKNRIRATLIGIVAYAFLYGFVQFMIPGGVLNK